MQVYTELTPPTAVTNAVHLSFLGPKANNLVVAKTSLLQIFEFRSIVTEANTVAKDVDPGTSAPADAPEPIDPFAQRTENTTKFVLVAEYPVSGTILSVARIKALDTKAGGDALLVAFRDAKLSLVEWDPVTHSLSTISIHYYEGEELQGSPWDADLDQHHNFLVADPSSRCAALKFGAHRLAILPFRQLGDDLVEGDYDPDFDEPPTAKEKETNGENASSKTPYTSSFALSLPQLDPTLTHPVHLDFLHEYREPTFGIISSTKAKAASLLYERKDILTFTVFTLDLEEKASTALLSVSGLPYDVYKVLPLAQPVGGALLLGGNELIHVDQAGKTNAVAVNEFAKQCSSFPMADQSDLAMRLEECVVEQLSSDNGDMLFILRDGSLAVLSFKLDGRNVASMSLNRVPGDRGGLVVKTAATCAAAIGRGRLFVGSEDSDSVILGWTRKTTQLARKRSHAEMLADDADLSFDDEEIEDDDDLYATGATSSKAASSAEGNAPGNYIFRIHDALPNLAPTTDVTLGGHSASARGHAAAELSQNELDLVLSTGRGKAGALAIVKREINPRVLRSSEFAKARAVWSVHAKKPVPKGLLPEGNDGPEARLAADADYDQLVIASRATDAGEESAVYTITDNGFEETTKGDFEREDAATIDVGTIAGGTRIVQILKGEIRSYDSELSLDQILPMEDENGAELRIISASFADPYILVLREDSSIIVLEADSKGEMEEIDRGDALLATKWLSGSVYRSAHTNDKALLYLLSAEGGMHVFELPNLTKPVYTAASLVFLPPVMTEEFTARRGAPKAAITEILPAELGDSTYKSPYLIVRTSTNDLIIYQPYHYPAREPGQPFTQNLRWRKISQPKLPQYSEEPTLENEDGGSESILKALPNVSGYSTVFLSGTSPSFILKEAASAPRLIKMRSKAVRSLCGFHTATCDRGFMSLDVDGSLYVSQLPPGFRFGDAGWAIRKVALGQEPRAVCYYPPRDVYVVGVSELVDFQLPDDEHHHEWADENISFRPRVEHGLIKVIEPQYWSTIDTYQLEATESVMCIKSLNLEISEITHERKRLVAVGTAIVGGEDLPSRGCLYIFEVINVVPEPGRPETNRRLKLIAKEEVRGAVTAVSEIGSQGFLIMAQGQKCLVRGLKEDGSLLPVAFMDMQCYVSVLKELQGTGMLLMGDLAKGLWFTGYTEDPYKMLLFGKSRSHMEILTAEFLPHDKQLDIIVADADCNLHVFQYDPDHPKSLSGQRLLHKSTFHVGHQVTSMTLLPSTISPAVAAMTASTDAMAVDGEEPVPSGPLHQILVTTQTGSLALMTPVDEQMYRRLSALQTYLSNVLEHYGGLNPRAYRAVESEGFGARGVLDGVMCARGSELGRPRWVEGVGRVGVEEWVLRSDLEVVGGGGLAFL